MAEGLLIIDHRAGSGIDGTKGTLEEYRTRLCVHCHRLIALYRVSRTEEVAMANIDVGRATIKVKDGHRKEEYVGKRKCTRCNDYVCRLCAAEVELLGTCPGPFEAKIENAQRTGVWDENYVHQYGAVSLPG